MCEMIFSYYPGCTLRTKGKDLDMYARKAAEALGVTMEEIQTLTASVQPAAILAEYGSGLQPTQRDILRANKVRSALEKLQ